MGADQLSEVYIKELAGILLREKTYDPPNSFLKLEAILEGQGQEEIELQLRAIQEKGYKGALSGQGATPQVLAALL